MTEYFFKTKVSSQTHGNVKNFSSLNYTTIIKVLDYFFTANFQTVTSKFGTTKRTTVIYETEAS